MASAPSFLQGNGASYIRVASIAIGAYDYLVTLPAEWRFYRDQRGWKISPGCILFILIRYVSIAAIVVSNVGYFGNFSKETCSHYYIAAPIFKILQMIISQVILGIRAYNISRRSTWVMWSLLVIFILVTAMEAFTNLWKRAPVQNKSHNCTPGNTRLSVWLFYVLAMSYDLYTLAISSYFLVQFTSSISRMTGLIRLMFYDGLGFFVALTGANIFNLILYRTTNESFQSSGASIGYAVTWIMSQRILIHLRDAAAENRIKNVIVSQKINNGRDISRAMRSQYTHNSQHKDRLNDEYDLKNRSLSGSGTHDHTTSNPLTEVDLDIHVQVEQTVTVDYVVPSPYDQRHHDQHRSQV
ncbi:hypothetical protein BXZ70DRAFT_932488 [Cristinia sonorae]|uniref:DUF6533 domain-containing protein n=1 Tax=Cristinia sonorae TaxID=1940300 RepID=A0A8K0XR84_9AGAR|nr:hypothetical protein BXZ70DRAFT_932488 [Cristinia sonorae]